MTINERVARLEQAVDQLSFNQHLIGVRTNWLVSIALEHATQERCEELDRENTRAILESADAGIPLALEMMTGRGLVAPDALPVELGQAA